MARLLCCILISFVCALKSMADSDSDYCSLSPVSPASSTSVLAGLMESSYTDLAELFQKASLLQMLENEVSRHNVTILAPSNSCFEGPAQESFRRFLLEPANQRLLQRLLEFHVMPRRLTAAVWPSSMAMFKTLSADFLQLWTVGNKMKVGFTTVVAPDAIVSYDGVVHGVDGFLVPKIVQQAFREWKKKRFNSFG